MFSLFRRLYLLFYLVLNPPEFVDEMDDSDPDLPPQYTDILTFRHPLTGEPDLWDETEGPVVLVFVSAWPVHDYERGDYVAFMPESYEPLSITLSLNPRTKGIIIRALGLWRWLTS